MPLTSRKHHKNRSPRADGTHMNNRTTVLARVQFFSRNISQGFQSVFVNNRAPTELTNTHSALHVNNSTGALNIEGTKDDGMEEVGEEELDSGRTSWTSSGTESTMDTTPPHPKRIATAVTTTTPGTTTPAVITMSGNVDGSGSCGSSRDYVYSHSPHSGAVSVHPSALTRQQHQAQAQTQALELYETPYPWRPCLCSRSIGATLRTTPSQSARLLRDVTLADRADPNISPTSATA